MKKLSSFAKWMMAASLYVLVASLAMGQDYRARVEGVVTDQSKAWSPAQQSRCST